MSVPRVVIRLILLGAGFIAATVVAVALTTSGEPESWSAIAGSLAVIAASAAAYGAVRVVELEEDKRKPNVRVYLDTRSRYGLAQLVIHNIGGGVAKAAQIQWQRQLTDADGSPIGFSIDQFRLEPDEHVSVLVGAVHKLMQAFHGPDARFPGTVIYQDSLGQAYEASFVIDLEQHRKELTHIEEEPRTHSELQKLPGLLEKMTSELHSIRTSLERDRPEKR